MRRSNRRSLRGFAGVTACATDRALKFARFKSDSRRDAIFEEKFRAIDTTNLVTTRAVLGRSARGAQSRGGRARP